MTDRLTHRRIAVDYLVLGYTVFTSALFLLFPHRVLSRTEWLIFNTIVIAFVIAAGKIDPSSGIRWIRLLRRYYPLILFTFYYEQTGSLIHVFFDGWFDHQIVAFESALLGFQPAISVEHLYTPVLNEIIIGCYISYYLWLPAGLTWLLIKGEEGKADKLLLSASVVFFLSYATFVFYPVEGPRHFLLAVLSSQMDGYLFVPLVQEIMRSAAVHGGAMPSSHTAVALIVLMSVWRHLRKIRIPLLVIFAGLMSGCVWGRFHYLSDVVVGIIMAVFVFYIVEKRFATESANEVVSINS